MLKILADKASKRREQILADPEPYIEKLVREIYQLRAYLNDIECALYPMTPRNFLTNYIPQRPVNSEAEMYSQISNVKKILEEFKEANNA